MVEKEKNSSFKIVTVVFIILVLSLIAGNFAYKYHEANKKLDNINTSNNNQNNSNNQNNEQLQNCPQCPEIKPCPETKPCPEVKPCPTLKALPIPNHSTNKNHKYKLIATENGTGLTAILNEDRKSVTLRIVWDKFGPNLNTVWAKGNIETYKVVGFSKNIVDIYIYGYGQVAGHETLYCIMEDGTIEYVNIPDALSKKDGDLKVTGKIEGQKGFIKIKEVDMGSGYSVVGVKADGTIYDIAL